jgi:single-stranded DNA-binding protein
MLPINQNKIMISSYNKCFILGRVVNIENTQTKSGLPVSRAVIETQYKNSYDQIPCSFYGDMAKEAQTTMKAEDKVYIIGRLTWQFTETKKIAGVIVEQFSLMSHK